MTPLERAALAVRDEIAHPHGNGEWILDDGFRDDAYFADVARAVITAIREPSDRMAEDGALQIPCGQGVEEGPPNIGDAKDCWQAMIDHILEHG